MRSRRFELSQRPLNFTLNPEHPWVAKGELVFAGLGNAPGGLVYHDSSRDHLGGQGGNHGTLTNMVPATDWVWSSELGRIGCFFHGDNSTDNVVLTSTVSFANTIPFTVAWWANLDVLHNADMFVSATNSSIRQYSTTSICRMSNEAAATANSGTDFITTGLQHHAISRNAGNSISFYRNGVEHSTNTLVGVIAIARLGSTVDAMNGRMYDPLIHNRVLSLPEIQSLADPSNVMLSGLLLPPRRRLFASAAAPATNYVPNKMRYYRNRRVLA